MRTVDSFQLELDSAQPVAEIGALLGEDVLIDLAAQTQIQKAVLLLNEQRLLSLKLNSLCLGLCLFVFGL